MNDTYWVEWIIVATIESTYSMKECLKMVKKEMKAKGLAFSFSEKYGDYQLLEIANE
jgi:ribosomal silencing factor RsfS